MAIRQGLASIGIDVAINSVSMNYVTDIGDIGGSPEMLDATCLKDVMQHNVIGVQQTDSFPVTFLYDGADAASDFVVLKALQKAKTVVPIVVTMPDGSKHESEGEVSVHVTGVGVNALIQAQADFALSKDWEFTKGGI